MSKLETFFEKSSYLLVTLSWQGIQANQTEKTKAKQSYPGQTPPTNQVKFDPYLPLWG